MEIRVHANTEYELEKLLWGMDLEFLDLLVVWAMVKNY